MKFLLATVHSKGPPLSGTVRFLNLVAAIFVLSFLFVWAFLQLDYPWNWSAVYPYRLKFIQGWAITILISMASLVLSFAIGMGVALLRRHRLLILRHLCMVYVELIRGTPLLVQILIVYYVFAQSVGLENRYVVGVLCLSLFSGAYISEILRAGIESVGRTQWDSARSIGLTTRQIYRYVIFPQALRQSLPPLAGQFVSLVKDSSLLTVIAINEFTQNAREVNAMTFSAFESYIPLAIGYLLLTLPISLWTRQLERRHHYET